MGEAWMRNGPRRKGTRKQIVFRGLSSAFLPMTPSPDTRLYRILARRRGTDCCRLATVLVPRKPKALDAQQGWEASGRKKQPLVVVGCSWIWGPARRGMGKLTQVRLRVVMVTTGRMSVSPVFSLFPSKVWACVFVE